MITGSLYRRYAKALMGIGIETKSYEKFAKDLDRFAAVLNNEELLAVLENPSYPQSQRKAVVEQLVARSMITGTVKNFILLLHDKGRIAALPGIAREFQNMVDQQAKRVRAKVSSAHKLDLASVSRLKKSLEQKTGKQIILEQRTDPELIGGVVTQIGSIVYDGSIRTQLEQLRHNLIEGEA